MEQKAEPSCALQQFLRVYRIEPIGHVLSGRLRLPLPVLWFIFAFLNFGVRMITHGAIGTPRPTNFADAFRLPVNFYYYPNLIAISYDLIGIPLMVALLVFFSSYILAQFVQLEQGGFISEKLRTSRIDKLLHFLGTSGQIQTLAIIVFPLLVAVLGLVVDIRLFSPQDVPALYATWFQSPLGRYARAAILVQLVYVFIILGNYKLGVSRLHFGHPDECSGLAPFGKLAIAGYIYLFVHAMSQAIGTIAGGTGFERALRNLTGSAALIYLWILFPLAVIIIFSQLVYKPHRKLQELQREHLLNASAAWTDYHQQLTFNIERAVKQSEAPLVNKASVHFSDDLELLEVWAKLNKYVEDMHTWPIPKRTFRTVAVLANPLIPVILPVMVNAVRNLLP